MGDCKSAIATAIAIVDVGCVLTRKQDIGHLLTVISNGKLQFFMVKASLIS